MKRSEMQTLVKSLAPAILEILKPLEAKIAALEAKPSVEYRGVHQTGTTYAEGNLITRSGSLWLALRETTQTPGQSGDWRLVVKRGEA
jgi:hypothetical protein